VSGPELCRLSALGVGALQLVMNLLSLARGPRRIREELALFVPLWVARASFRP
jgi:hypothetical protein